MAVATLTMDTRVDARTKRNISLLDRVELEEKHLHLYEENMLLKKHAKGQEEKMKRLATKLIKLSKDNKKIRQEGGTNQENEEKLVELSDKLRQFETQNANLKGKVSVLRQQLDSRWKRHTPYDNVKSRTDSGLVKKSLRSFSTEDVSSSKRSNTSGQQASPNPLRYGRSLLEKARRDNEQLEELVLSLKEEISLLRAECDGKEEENKLQLLAHEEKVLKLQEQLQHQLTETQRSSVEEDAVKIKLQRELKLNQSLLQQSKGHYEALELELKTAQSRLGTLSKEVTSLNEQLAQSHEKCRELQNKLKSSDVEQRTVTELQDMITDLKFEKDLLKQRNERLTQNLLKSVSSSNDDGEGNGINRLQEKRQLHELENKILTQNIEIKKLINKLDSEREVSERLDLELSEVKGQYLTLQNKHDQLLQKLGCHGNKINWEELNEAIATWKERKVVSSPRPSPSPPPSLTPPTTNIIIPSVIDSSQELDDLRLAYNQVTNELNKTNKLLSLQTQISHDYKKETGIVRNQLEHCKGEHERKLAEKNQLIDIKNERIKMLETKLKDLAYRRQPHPLPRPPVPISHSTPLVPISATEIFTVPSSLANNNREEPSVNGSNKKSVVLSPPTHSPVHTPTHSPVHTPTRSLVHTPTRSPVHTPTRSPVHTPTCSRTPTQLTQEGGVSPTDYSIEEELTDVTNDDDTMFGDSTEDEIPLPHFSTTNTVTPSPTKPSVLLLLNDNREDDCNDSSVGDSLDLSEEEEESEEEVKSKSVLPMKIAQNVLTNELNNVEVHFSMTIISFTMEEDSLITNDPTIHQLFVEYQFLDYDISELETPVSVEKPSPGQPAVFNFTKDFHILPMTNTMKLLQELLLSTDPVININVVSDPEGETNEEECQELGTNILNLVEVIEESGGSDSVILDEDVCSIPDNELIGFITLKFDGLNSLRQFSHTIQK